MMRWFLTLAVTVLLGIKMTLAVPVDADRKIDGERIAKLIAQLGSDRFTEREEASKALAEIGLPAYEALKKAVNDPDAEVQRRARELLAKLERLVETEKVLAPTRVRLQCQASPVADAVAQLAKKSGHALILNGDRARLAERTVTLDTGDTTFWQAFDQLCASANLVEANQQHGVIAQPGQQHPATTIVLVDGKPETYPTHYAGAARIRILPGNQPKDDKEVSLLLEVRPEPGMHWKQGADARIARAIDEQGQALAQQVPEAVAPVGGGIMVRRRVAVEPQVSMLRIPVRLKLQDKPSKVLKELSGAVAAQVQTGPHPLITVDDVLKSTGKTFKGDKGGAMTLHEAKKLDNGQYKLRVQIEAPPQENNNAIGGIGNVQVQAIQVQIVGGNGRIGIPANLAATQNLILEDAKGQKLPYTVNASKVMINNNFVTHEYTLTYQPQNDQGDPAKLIYSGSRTATIDVPFSLKDVPLP